MNSTYTNRWSALLAGAFLVFGLVSPSAAQDLEDNDESVLIEVRDGVIFVDGKEVSRLENKDTPIRFKSDAAEGSHAFYFGNDNGTSVLWNKVDDRFHVFGGNGNVIGYKADGDELRSKIMSRYMDSAGLLADRNMDLFSLNGDMVSRNPEVARMESESRDLASRIRRGDGVSSDLESQLDALLGKIFDKKLEASQERVDNLRSDLSDLEERIAQRRSDKQQILDMRRRELLGERSRFDW